MNEIEVRDRRRPPFYIIEKHVHDRYAKRAGMTAWAIYCTLARFAREDEYCPGMGVRTSVSQMAQLWGIDQRTVKRATSKLRQLDMIRVKKTQGISIISLHAIEQLNFTQQLLSGGDTSAPTGKKPEGTTMPPPKGHVKPLPGDNSAPLLKTVSSKTVSSKKEGSSRGIEPRPGSSRFELEKLKTELAKLREEGQKVMKLKGPRHKDVYAISDQVDQLHRKIRNLTAKVQ